MAKGEGDCELTGISFVPLCNCQCRRGAGGTDGDVILLLLMLSSHMASILVDTAVLCIPVTSTVKHSEQAASPLLYFKKKHEWQMNAKSDCQMWGSLHEFCKHISLFIISYQYVGSNTWSSPAFIAATHCYKPHAQKRNYVRQWGALRSPGQAVISSREIGSMDRKSRGRGRRGPIWEVQCKQSQLLIIPAHVRNWTHFDVILQYPLHPPLLSSQTAVLRASRGAGVQIVAWDALERRGGIHYLVGHWDEKMWSVAQLPSVKP